MKVTINGNPLNFIEDKIRDGVTGAVDSAKEVVVDAVRDATMWVLEGLAHVIVDLSFSAALIGGGICVILKIAGWKDGFRWAGILFVANVLIQYILG